MAELVLEIAGQEVRRGLTKELVTVGRAPDNDVVVDDQSVSRHHARILHEGAAWRFVDVGSKNGTAIEGKPGKDTLSDGDVVLFGAVPVKFTEAEHGKVDLAAPAATTAIPQMEMVSRKARDFTQLISIGPQAFQHDPRAQLVRMQILLSIMGKASASLLVSRTLDDSLTFLLDVLFEHLPAERGFILTWDPGTQSLVLRASKLKRGPDAGGPGMRISSTIANRVLADRVAVLIADAQSDPRFAGGQSVMSLGIRSAMVAPLVNGDKVEGIIWVDTAFEAKAFDEFDLDVVSALGNHAAIAIEHDRLQESVFDERMQRQRLERYHSPAVAERIAKSGGEQLTADERDVTVLFADVVGFTSRCEKLEPRGVAEFLNRCFSRMADAIFKHEGTLDKFIGDCVMAVFGAPLAQPDHALRAVSAAVDMRDAIAELNEELDEAERVQFRVGMNSGKVVAGDIGSVRRRDYTVLGATVNLASRMESSVAKPGMIVVTDTTWDVVKDHFETRFVTEAQPKGISRIVKCYEVLGRRTSA